jgi:hypothetical protein
MIPSIVLIILIPLGALLEKAQFCSIRLLNTVFRILTACKFAVVWPTHIVLELHCPM